jgi:hypothetical protein
MQKSKEQVANQCQQVKVKILFPIPYAKGTKGREGVIVRQVIVKQHEF